MANVRIEKSAKDKKNLLTRNMTVIMQVWLLLLGIITRSTYAYHTSLRCFDFFVRTPAN